MAERIRTAVHKGKTILVVDLTNSQPAETLPVLLSARQKIGAAEPKSVRLMLIVNGAVYNKDVAEAIKDFSKSNTPYMLASAVVGIQGVQSILLQTVVFITRREIKAFDTQPEALEWLASK